MTTMPRFYDSETDFSSASGTVALGNMSGISFSGSNPWSFEIWFSLDALLDTTNLISRESEFVLQTQGGTIYAARTNQVVALTTPAILQPNVWYYLALTFDGTTMRLYLDGAQQALVTLVDSGIGNSGNPMTIGGGFYGQINSARFWNTSLPIGQLYQNQFTDYTSGTANLLAQIDFTQSPPVDTSGNDTPVTVSSTGVELVAFTPSVSLDSSSFCDPYDDSPVNPGGTQSDFSVMAWVAPSYLNGTQLVFSNGVPGVSGMSLGVTSQGNVQFQVGGATPVVSNAQLSNGSWANIAATWSASSGAAALYVNGNADNTGTMAFGTGLASGTPLIGGGVLSDGCVGSSFIGYVQSVDVWNYVLSATDVTNYLTESPITDTGCVADYDFSLSDAQNSMTMNPIGLVGAMLTTTMTSLSLFGSSSSTSVVAGTAAPSSPAIAAQVESFRAFMTDSLRIPVELQQPYLDLMRENLERVEREIAAGTHRPPARFTTESLPGGVSRIIMHTDEGSAVIFEGILDPCTTWVISFLIAIGSALLAVFGIAVTTQAGQNMATYLSTRITPYITRIQSIFSSGSVSPNLVWLAIKQLNSDGLLLPMLKFGWSGVISWWAALNLGARIALLISPVAALEVALLISQLALALTSVYAVWQSPDNCWVNNEAPQLRVA